MDVQVICRLAVRRALQTLVVLVVLTTTRIPAWAQAKGPFVPTPDGTREPLLTVVFDVERSEVPSHVCVVSPLNYKDQYFDLSNRNQAWKPTCANPSADTGDTAEICTWRLDDASEKVADKLHFPRSPSGAPTEDECAGRCRHVFETTTWKSGYMTCAANEDPDSTRGSEPRVAVIRMGFDRDEASSATITRLAFRGSVVSLEIDRNKIGFASGSVRGGAYVPGDTAPNINGIIRLRLLPRCRTHEVELPPAPATTANETAAVSLSIGRDTFRCGSHAGRHFTMKLPNERPRMTKILSVSVRGSQVAAPEEVLEARWPDLEPPAVVRPRTRVISFSWRQSCFYPERLACPAAELAAVGISCNASLAYDTCHYRCAPGENEAATTFDLPTVVRLRPADDESWDEQLSYRGQELRGYTAPTDRHAIVDLSQWGSPSETDEIVNGPAAKIRLLTFRDAGGTERRVPLSSARHSRLRVAVPGATCAAPFTYTYEGDEEFDQETFVIDRGTISLPRPQNRFFYPGVAVGGGALVSPMPFGALPYALVRGELVWRFPWDARVKMSMRRFGFAGRLTYMFSYKDAWIGSEGRSVLYNRLALDFAWLIFGSRVRASEGYWVVGFAPGMMLGGPWHRDDVRVTGPWRPNITGSAFFRWYLFRSLSVEGLFRVSSEATTTLFIPPREQDAPARAVHGSYSSARFFFEGSLRYGR